MTPRPLLSCLSFAAMPLLVLTACTQTLSLVPAGQHHTQGPVWVDLTNSWSRYHSGPAGRVQGQVLTRDGLTLNRLHIATIAPGASFVRPQGFVQSPPRYQIGMTQDQIVDFVLYSLGWIGFTDLQPVDLHEQSFGDLKGLRFGLNAMTGAGLTVKGDTAIIEHAGGLTMIVFLSPAGYYFDRDAKAVDTLMNSARVNGGQSKP